MVALYDRVDAYAADQLKFLRITQGVSQVTPPTLSANF